MHAHSGKLGVLAIFTENSDKTTLKNHFLERLFFANMLKVHKYYGGYYMILTINALDFP